MGRYTRGAAQTSQIIVKEANPRLVIQRFAGSIIGQEHAIPLATSSLTLVTTYSILLL